MSFEYKPSSAGLRQLMNGTEMQEMLRGVAEQGMADAIVRAPVYSGKPRKGVVPGEYKAHFSVTVQTDGGVHHDRAEALIVNDSAHSVLVEWHDEFHTLRDAAEELGGVL